MTECPKKLLFGQVKGRLRGRPRSNPVSMMLCYVIVMSVTSTDHLGMLRIDCSGNTRLALHVPSSYELESVNIIVITTLVQGAGPQCIHDPSA